MTQLDHLWRKSSRSNNNGACVEVRRVGGLVQMRDTKAMGDGPVLDFPVGAFADFVAGAAGGEFEL